jgi:CBS domain-containing protein
METTLRPVHSLTAWDEMNRDIVVVPRQMLVRDAARLLNRVRASVAPVVNENGSCIGFLSMTDVFRWVEDGCPEGVVGPDLTCPYQVQGRLLGGGEATICLLTDGNCPFQAVQPTTGGRHTDLCMLRRTERSPFGTVPGYMTSDVVRVRSQATLHELVRQIIDARTDRLIVLDEFDRPIGIASAPDVLNAVANDGNGHRFSGDPPNKSIDLASAATNQ